MNDNKVYCQRCGTEIREYDEFCPKCGAAQIEYYANIPEDPSDMPAAHKKNGGKIALIVVLVILLLAVIGAAGFLVYRSVAVSSTETVDDEEDLNDEMIDEDDVDLDDVDINAVDNSYCTLAGNVKKASNGTEELCWGDELTIYALDASGEKVLVEDVKKVYVDDTKLQTGLLAAIAANEKVKIGGDLSVRGDTLCLEANKVMNEDGVELVLEKGKTETITDEEAQSKEKQKTTDVGGYVLPQSSSRLLTNADVAGLSLQQVNYAKNEIYARHGRLFDSRELQNYFNSQGWYSGTVAPANFSESMLSDVEKKNVEFLKNLEFSMSPNGYQLDQ